MKIIWVRYPPITTVPYAYEGESTALIGNEAITKMG